MREPIKPEDIREGDEVVGSSNGFATRFRVAHIDNGRLYAEQPDGSHSSSAFLWAHECEWSLVDRATPALDLPTTGTHLGWLTHRGVRSLLAFDFHSEKWVEDASFGAVSRESVEAWMPAVAVPKAAFDALDEHYEHRVEVADIFGASAWNESLKAIDVFLGMVDLANGGTR